MLHHLWWANIGMPWLKSIFPVLVALAEKFELILCAVVGCYINLLTLHHLLKIFYIFKAGILGECMSWKQHVMNVKKMYGMDGGVITALTIFTLFYDIWVLDVRYLWCFPPVIFRKSCAKPLRPTVPIHLCVQFLQVKLKGWWKE